MKAQPYKNDGRGLVPCTPQEATYLGLHMDGPWPDRMLPIAPTTPPGPVWKWNGDVDRPSLTPSVLTKGTPILTSEQIARVHAGEDLKLPEMICHIYVTDGQVQYLGDCTHEFAGQTRPLRDYKL